MAAVSTPLTLEEFHRLYDDSEKPYREYWFGEVIPKPMPTVIHAALQFVIMFLLKSRGWKAFPEVRLKLHPEAEPVPDVIVVAPGNKIQSPYPRSAFDLCIKIRSPGDPINKLFGKASYYLNWGISTIWIIDPQARTAWMMTAENRNPVWIHPDQVLRAGEMEISLQELFAELDEQLSATLLTDEDLA